jgi:phi13 family phage major tail protein
MANKVKFGLRNVYYAVITETADGIEYGTPKQILGAVNMSLTASGDSSDFYADDVAFFSQYANQGYEGSLEIALLPEDFKVDVLGEVKDTNGALIEKGSATAKNFALGFEVQGDSTARRTWMYYCSASRPSVEEQTTEASITPKTDTLNLKATPRSTDTKVKVVMTRTDENSAVFESFFKSVYEQQA